MVKWYYHGKFAAYWVGFFERIEKESTCVGGETR
jgi:hypothetical protein